LGKGARPGLRDPRGGYDGGEGEKRGKRTKKLAGVRSKGNLSNGSRTVKVYKGENQNKKPDERGGVAAYLHRKKHQQRTGVGKAWEGVFWGRGGEIDANDLKQIRSTQQRMKAAGGKREEDGEIFLHKLALNMASGKSED